MGSIEVITMRIGILLQLLLVPLDQADQAKDDRELGKACKAHKLRNCWECPQDECEGSRAEVSTTTRVSCHECGTEVDVVEYTHPTRGLSYMLAPHLKRAR